MMLQSTPPISRLLASVGLGLAFGCTGAACSGDSARDAREPHNPQAQASAAANTSSADGPAHETQAAPGDEVSADLPAPPDLDPPPADAQKLASGLVTKLLAPGKGDRTPGPHDSVRVNFTGWNTRGKVINSSKRLGGPATFALDGVVAGWAEGLQLMHEGERRRLWVPDHLGYKGRPGPPRGNEVFDIELLEIIEGKAPQAPADVAAPPDDATRTKSGLAFKILQPGTSEDKPNAWDRVTLSYAGWTSEGELFESAAEATFDMPKVMPGWREALQHMTSGQRARLWVPEALAYQGRPGPPKGTLVFDMELRSIARQPEPPRAPVDVAAPPKDARKSASGLAYRVLKQGAGKQHPKASSRVRVHYSGWTSDGKLFDSSVQRGAPATVPLSAVIPGWTEMLQQMVEGDKRILWVPEALAYKGKPGSPAGTLVYELELLEILQ